MGWLLIEISTFSHAQKGNERCAPLAVATKQWGDLTMRLAQNIQANPEELGAAANDYLYYSGYVAIAYLLATGVAAAEAGTHSPKRSSRPSATRPASTSPACCRAA